MAIADLPRHRFTVPEYHRMAEVGLLHPDARVELIEGEIVDMSPIGRPHRGLVNRISRVLHLALQGRAIVQVQSSVILSHVTEPEPDIAILRWRADDYFGKDPGPDDTLVLIEVGDSSRRYDRVVKAPLYARLGVPEVWLVDVPAWTLRVLNQPSADGYTYERIVEASGSLTVLDVAIPLADVLGHTPG